MPPLFIHHRSRRRTPVRHIRDRRALFRTHMPTDDIVVRNNVLCNQQRGGRYTPLIPFNVIPGSCMQCFRRTDHIPRSTDILNNIISNLVADPENQGTQCFIVNQFLIDMHADLLV